MASTAARQPPGGKGVFIRGMKLAAAKGSGWGGAGERSRFRRGSAGLTASAGMAQDLPNFRAPGMRPWPHSCCTVRTESFHVSAISCTVRYSMAHPPGEDFISHYMRHGA